jgi:hypothetical protein
MMEIIFGFVLGGGLALGLWRNRTLIAQADSDGDAAHPDDVEISPAAEWTLALFHAGGLAAWNFMSFDRFDAVADHALTMGFIPLIAICGGRYWPYLLSFPLLALPIAGKTLRELSYKTEAVPMADGWIWLFAVPMAIMIAVALCFVKLQRKGQTARAFARWGLLCAAWFYFVINFAIFRLPWPWALPTFRTYSGYVLFAFTAILTVAALTWVWRTRPAPQIAIRSGDVRQEQESEEVP